MEGHPLPLLAFAVCALTIVASLVTGSYAILLMFSRTRVLTVEARDRGLSWGERAARSMNRFSVFLTVDEFRSLRHLMFGAWAGFLGSFCLLLLLAAMLGRRV